MTLFDLLNQSVLEVWRKKRKSHLVPLQFVMKWQTLEELGFIEKTHTSSGRVPSEKGYRYYVDHFWHRRS